MADNTTTKNATGGTVTMRTVDVGSGVQAQAFVPCGTDGSPLSITSGKMDVRAVRGPSDEVSTTGTIAANGATVAFDVRGMGTAGIQVSGTYVATLQFEGSMDNGVTWTPVQCARIDATTVEITSASMTNATRAWEMSCAVLTHVRVTCTAYTSGTVNVVIVASPSQVTSVAKTMTLDRVSGYLVAGTSSTHLGKAENATHASGDTGVAMLAVRRDARQTDVSATGDYANLHVDALNALRVTGQVTTDGGASVYRLISAATTNAQAVKTGAGQLYGWHLFNGGAATRYVKLYNKASAPTVGTDTPAMTIPLAAGSGANVNFSNGVKFATGIALAITAGLADSDTAAVAANDVVVNLFYA